MLAMESDRLRLRAWKESDLAPFAEINADPDVAEFLPRVLSAEESDDLALRIRALFAEHSFGLWAAEEIASQRFMGFVGLMVPNFDAHFMPCVEIGWRLGREHWGKGYATEGARLALRYAFEHLSLDEIVSFTVPMNERSQSVMRKLGMTHDPEDNFDHPKLPDGDRLRRHVLYRLTREAWDTSQTANA